MKERTGNNSKRGKATAAEKKSCIKGSARRPTFTTNFPHFELSTTLQSNQSIAMDYNTRTGNKASQEEKRPCEDKKGDHEHHEHHEHHAEAEEKTATVADTGKFGGLDDHAATTDSSAKTHSTSYTD
jgi:hypothetical protein